MFYVNDGPESNFFYTETIKMYCIVKQAMVTNTIPVSTPKQTMVTKIIPVSTPNQTTVTKTISVSTPK